MTTTGNQPGDGRDLRPRRVSGLTAPTPPGVPLSRRHRLARRWRTPLLAAFLVATATALALPGTMAGAATDDAVKLEAVVDGRPVRGVGSNNAIEVGGAPSAALRLTVTNDGDEAIELQEVRLEGTALGVTFLAYDAVVPVTVEAGEQMTLDVALPITDIQDQTIGLVPASISLFDAAGQRVAQQTFTLDVDGSVRSAFGVLGLLIAAFTICTMLMNLWLVLRRRMPPNRFARGVRFAVPGAGLGLVVCITLAGFRVVAPYPSTWLPLVLLPAAVAFVIGFLSPGALSFEEDEVDVALRDRELATAGESS